jgi:predicted NBD/HSP70 family sugar kinase
VSRDGARLRLYVSLGRGKVKAIFIDSDGNIISQGSGETIAKAAEDVGAEGVL